PAPEDDIGSLERARESLYSANAPAHGRMPLGATEERTLQHAWEEKKIPSHGARHVRLASIFFGFAVVFFLVTLAVAGYFFYFGSNSVSVDKVTIDIQGPTTIAGGDTVPFSITITNKNPVALENATIEITFPEGTRSSSDVQIAYPRYVENIGPLASGAVVTRSVKAVVFGGAGQTITLPVSFSYGTASSNAVFYKKSSYALAISSTPLSVSVDGLTETVSGAPLTFNMTVRSNSNVPLDNVVLTASMPFGFSVTSSSLPISNSTFSLGTLAPGESKQVALSGTLTGQDSEQRTFHFTVGTAKSAQDQTLAVTYMTQDANVMITAPFIMTSLVLNGKTSDPVVLTPGHEQSATLNYINTLSTMITDVSVTISIAGSAVNYNSIRTTSGFYNSANHTIVFSKDTDPALASLAPGASGIGTFSFSTLPVGTQSPTVMFSISALGTRVGQANVPEKVTTSAVSVAKVATVVTLQASSSHKSGPVPPVANQATDYAITWSAKNGGSAVAGGTVMATLPSYVSYVGATSGAGTFSYNSVSHTLTWTTGDLVQGGRAEGTFRVSLVPSTSQRGGTVSLTSTASFSGHDRFSGVQISATADPVTTETQRDPGYVPTDAIVQ
ncbi:MAG: hypothetical protein WCW36_01335, partial [Candidatus Paceibacterota bacterium]